MRTIFNKHLLIGFALLVLLLPSAAMASKATPTPGGPVGPDPASICNVIAGNLLANCGFETGDFTGWTQSGDTGYTGVGPAGTVGYDPNSGTYFAYLGPVGSDGFLSQTFADTLGATYLLQWYLNSNGSTPNDFDAEVDGVTLFTATDIPNTSGYVHHTYDFVGTGADTVTFSFRDDPDYLALDDTSVSPAITVIPEPGTFVLWSLALVTFIAVAWWKRRSSSGASLGVIS